MTHESRDELHCSGNVSETGKPVSNHVVGCQLQLGMIVLQHHNIILEDKYNVKVVKVSQTPASQIPPPFKWTEGMYRHN